MTRLPLILSLAGAIFWSLPSHAEIGIRGAGGKIGLDVVQSEDTRFLVGVQIDVGTLLSPSLHVEPNFEFGKGLDERGEEKRVYSSNLALKYVLEEEKTRVFGYFSGEIGVNVFSAVLFQGVAVGQQGQMSTVWSRKTDVRSSLNVVPIGLGRKLAGCDRGCEAAHDRRPRLAAVAAAELRLERVEERLPIACRLVPERVDEPGEAVDGTEVRTGGARREQRHDREVLAAGARVDPLERELGRLEDATPRHGRERTTRGRLAGIVQPRTGPGFG